MKKAIICSFLVFLWLGFANSHALAQPNQVLAFTPLPPDMQVIAPDPNLPPEIQAFSGIWEGTWCFRPHKGAARDTHRATLIVEKIVSPEKVRLIYSWGSTAGGTKPGWKRYWGRIIKENGNYSLSYESISQKRGRVTRIFALKGDKLISWSGYYLAKSEIEMKRRP